MDITQKEAPLRGTKADSRMAAHRAMWRLQRHASEGLLFLKRRRRIRLRRFRVRFRCAPEVLEFLPHEDEWSDVEDEDAGEDKPKGWTKGKGRRGSGVRYKASSWDPDDMTIDSEEMQPPLMLCILCVLAIALAAAYQWVPRPGFMPFT